MSFPGTQCGVNSLLCDILCADCSLQLDDDNASFNYTLKIKSLIENCHGQQRNTATTGRRQSLISCSDLRILWNNRQRNATLIQYVLSFSCNSEHNAFTQLKFVQPHNICVLKHTALLWREKGLTSGFHYRSTAYMSTAHRVFLAPTRGLNTQTCTHTHTQATPASAGWWEVINVVDQASFL